jgi:hypothetical protein
MPSRLTLVAALVLSVLPGGCDRGARVESTSSPTATTEVAESTTTEASTATTQAATTLATTGDEQSYRALIKISSTSDWAIVRLVGGGEWQNPEVVSTSGQDNSGFEHDGFSLNQTLEAAESGGSVELTAEVFLSGLSPADVLVFEIERGHIGATQVEIMNYLDETPNQVAVLTWDGIAAGDRNAQIFEVSPEPFLGAEPNEYTVIAQINFWYYGPGQHGGFEHADGSRMTPLTPLLGDTYAAADPSVVNQQIEWAVEYGVDAFSVEWTTPRGIGCCGSMEDTLDDVFLKSPNIHKIRWVLFYDFILRMRQTTELNFRANEPIDFDRPEVYDTFVADLERFAAKYFGHPQYLTIDGRPVIYIWATNSYEGDLAGAMQEARHRVSELGFDVFVVGDEVRTDLFDPDHVALFDGSSTFTFLIPGIDGHALADVGEATTAVDEAFTWWRDQLKGTKVTGRDEEVNFQPAWAPQYDESFFISDNPLYVPATSKEQVAEMASMIRNHAEPVGNSGQRLIWLNTWNNWAETTTVEPTADLGPKYPAGNYQFDLLEVNRDVFGRETFFDSPVP